MKMYKKHATRLRQTGGGPEDEDGGSSHDQQLDYYIPADGLHQHPLKLLTSGVCAIHSALDHFRLSNNLIW